MSLSFLEDYEVPMAIRDTLILRYRFEKWVHLKKDKNAYFPNQVELKKRKRFILKKRKKFDAVYLRLHRRGRLQFYKDDVVEKPFLNLSLNEGFFKKTRPKEGETDEREEVHITVKREKNEPVTLVIRCLNNIDFENLCRLLGKVGCVETDLPEPVLRVTTYSAIRLFQSKPIEKWGVQDVLEWSKCIIINRLNETLYCKGRDKHFKENKIDGKTLLGWVKADILKNCEELHIRTFRSKNRVKRALMRLQNSLPHYDPLHDIIYKKICFYFDRHKMKEFRHLNVMKTLRAFKDGMFEDASSIYFPSGKNIMKKKMKLRVKLIVFKNNYARRIFPKMINPLMRGERRFGEISKNNDSDDEDFHFSLQIGPKMLLEWSDSGLSHIRAFPLEEKEEIVEEDEFSDLLDMACTDLGLPNKEKEKVEEDEDEFTSLELCDFEVDDIDEFVRRKLVDELLRWSREFHFSFCSEMKMKNDVQYASSLHFVEHFVKFLELERNIRAFWKKKNGEEEEEEKEKIIWNVPMLRNIHLEIVDEEERKNYLAEEYLLCNFDDVSTTWSKSNVLKIVIGGVSSVYAFKTTVLM